MARAELKPGRQEQEIGAAIIGAWLKFLPAPATIVSVESSEGQDLEIIVDRQIFSPRQGIYLRTADGKDTTAELKVGMAAERLSNRE